MMCLPNTVLLCDRADARGKPNPCKGVFSSLTHTQACIQTPAMHRNVLCAIFCVTLSFLLPKSIPTPNQDNLLLSRVRLTFTLGFCPNNRLHAAGETRTSAHLHTCSSFTNLQ